VRHGSGFPRARDIVHALVRAGHFVTFYPTTFPDGEWASIYAELPREVEVMIGFGSAGLGEFLRQRRGYYDRILVSRPHNLQILRAHLKPWPARGVIYDAEALFAAREAEELALAGRRPSDGEVAQRMAEETRLGREVDVVLSVSPAEGQKFAAAGARRVMSLGHALEAAPTPRPFAERRGLLFVGAFHQDASPNSDAAVWFAREILPRVRAALGPEAALTIAGAHPSPRVVALAGPDVEVRGRVESLVPLYDEARLFVAPTRFAAGIPYKVHHAAAHGLPVVATSLLAGQLGWSDGRELLVADQPDAFAAAVCRLYRDAALWAELRQNALARIAAECSRAAFDATLEAALHLLR
jgi:glycosyltransferase involved in cell wall biosynthesis